MVVAPPRDVFTGEYVVAVDAKGRAIVPKQIKDKLPEEANGKLVLLKGKSGCIEAHAYTEWVETINAVLRRVKRYQEQHLRLRRRLFSQANDVGTDPQGRILLPKHLRESSGITDHVRFVSVGQWFEMWAPDRYAKYEAAADAPSYDELLELLDSEPTGEDGHPGTGVPRTGDGG